MTFAATSTVPPILVVGVGNPSRGDDALGPRLLDALAEQERGRVERGELELLTDFQLQIEHAMDLRGRRHVVFVDASVVEDAPFVLRPVAPRTGQAITSHALAPETLLAIHRDVYDEPCDAHVLAIRGQAFELGHDLSIGARNALEGALDALKHAIARWSVEDEATRIVEVRHA